MRSGQVPTLVEQLGVHGRRGLVDVVGVVQHLEHRSSLGLRQRPGLWPRRPRRALGQWALAVAAVVAGPGFAQSRTGGPGAHDRGQSVTAASVIFVSPVPSALSVANCSNSADSFPWTSITLWALSSSRDRRSFSLRRARTSRSRGSAGGRPEGWASAWRAPRSRWWRHSVMLEL